MGVKAIIRYFDLLGLNDQKRGCFEKNYHQLCLNNELKKKNFFFKST